MGKNLKRIAIVIWLAVTVACSLGDSLDDLEDGIDDLVDEGMKTLEELFPDLTYSELASISASLSIADIEALRDELEVVRKEVKRLSEELFINAEEKVKERSAALEPLGRGFPTAVEPIGRGAIYNEVTGDGTILISGVFRGEAGINITNANLSVTVGGAAQTFNTSCLYQGETVDIVFLLDITGSMSNVIRSVRQSIVSFVSAIESSGIKGTIGLVSYQDSVGVNTSFQQPAPGDNVERSPFFAPVPIDNATQVEALKRFITKLEANSGRDAPENLSGAIDFARNNVIGYTSTGAPNKVGDGVEDSPFTSPFPSLQSDRQVFIAFTDITFHGDSRDESNSSLLDEFVPRNSQDILKTLLQTGTVVNVSDPSWVDKSVSPTGASDEQHIDADYWAIKTGGVGEDIVAGYSLVDLELVVTASDSALLDITLDNILENTCFIEFNYPSLSVSADVRLVLTEGEETFEETLSFQRF